MLVIKINSRVFWLLETCSDVSSFCYNVSVAVSTRIEGGDDEYDNILQQGTNIFGSPGCRLKQACQK